MAAVPGAEWRVPLWNTAGFEPRPAARLRLESHYLSLSLFSPPPSPSSLLLVLVSSPRRLLPREHRYGPAIPSHPSASARTPGALSLSLSVSVRRAVRSLASSSRGYDAELLPPSLLSTLATMTRRREHADPRASVFSSR